MKIISAHNNYYYFSISLCGTTIAGVTISNQREGVNDGEIEPNKGTDYIEQSSVITISQVVIPHYVRESAV